MKDYTSVASRIGVLAGMSLFPVVAAWVAVANPVPSLLSPYPLIQTLLLLNGWPKWAPY